MLDSLVFIVEVDREIATPRVSETLLEFTGMRADTVLEFNGSEPAAP
jgi:hypothetical protein